MHGYPKALVRLGFKLGWPIIILGKKLSAYPFLGKLTNPLFGHPHNQLTAIPIHTVAIGEEARTENITLPIKVVEKLLAHAGHIMILDECICRAHMDKEPRAIGCLVLGQAALRIHPSNGHMATVHEAIAHVHKAAQAGLVANVAHVWIDPVGFGVTNFGQMLFVCFCGENACLYTDHLHRRVPNLEKAYSRLPGIRTVIDAETCDGCGTCVESCFVAAITVNDGKAVIGDACKTCGRCLVHCPRSAISIHMDDEDEVFLQLLKRVRSVADIA